MDPQKFKALFGVDSPPETPAPQAEPKATTQSPSQPTIGSTAPEAPEVEVPELDPAATQQFGHLLGSIQAGGDAAQAVAPPATVQDFIGKAAGAAGVSNTDDPNAQPMTEEQRNQAGALYGPAAGAGGLKSVFETKDFLFGDTPREQQSAFRQTVEDEDDRIRKASPIVGGLSSGIGQFTVAMIGLGKLGMVAKALPYVGEAVSAVESIKGGSIALESGKAALAGAIAFDPHEARLSNLIQDTPLANPFNAWLAAKPGDSAAMGRMKNAMESLGMDAAIISTFSGGLKIWKYLKAGDTTAASRAVTDLQAEQAAHVAEEQTPHASDVPPSGQDVEPPHTDTPPVPTEPVQDPLAPPKADGEAASPVDPKAPPEATPLEQGSPVADGIPFDLEGTRKTIDAGKVGRTAFDADHNKFSEMSTDDMGAVAGLEVEPTGHKFDDNVITEMPDTEKQKLWALPDAERRVQLQAELAGLAAKGYKVEALGDELRIAKWDGTQFKGAGADAATDRAAVLQFNKTMGRTVPVAEFNAMSQKAWAEAKTSKYKAANANELGAAAANADDIKVEQVANPTAAMDEAGVVKPQPFKSKVDFTAQDLVGNPARPGSQDVPKPGILDQVDVHLENAEKDWNAMNTYGGWSGVEASGKRLSPDMGTFYDRFRTDNDVIEYMDLAFNHKAEQLAAQGFRVKLTDVKLQQQVRAFASLTGVDPAGLAGLLQQAGEASRTLTAKMVVGGSLAAKTFQDASLLAMRRKLGDYSEFGSLEATEAEIAKRFSLSTTFAKLADDIRSQAGRTLRANRGKPFDPSLFEGLSKDRFYDLLAEAQGGPNKLKILAAPSLRRKIMDTVNYMRISSLVSGPKTQLINIMTNGYMAGIRPMERILGGAWQAARHPVEEAATGAGSALIRKNMMQYTYMGSALYDGFGQAVKAFTRNDGLLRPHGSEAFGPDVAWSVPGTQALGAGYFKPWDSLPNVLYNAFSIPLTAAGVAPRLLGGVDELVKQTVYRSWVAARAHMEASEQAVTAGLKGKAARDFTKSYVGTRLDNAFDAEGRGVDPEALREANIATFQQELLPGTFGKNVQSLISNDPTQLMRLILPFVKTPTNVIRYGWKMTPGLNMLQEEYRQMLNGAMGHEAKAQAVGQMTMGSLFMGAAAYLGSQGMITGGGPSDPKLKAQLLATGWQPYSIPVKHDDGTTSYIPFNRYDPVALPLGIIADIQDAYHIMGDDAESSPEIGAAIGALGVSLAKQFTSRTYLLSLQQALDAITDPDANGVRFAGSMAQSFVPFSGATRQLNTDPFMRDARTIADKMMQVIPGMSKDLPPKYNWLGMPLLNRQGLWSDENGSLVDHETLRLGIEGGSLLNPPSPKFLNKVDLRNITMTNGENAYVAYQRLAGKPGPNAKSLRDVVADVMRSKGYERAPDGDVGTRGTKLWLLAGRVGKYREAAGARIRADKNVRDALMAAQRKVADHYAHLKQEQTPEQRANVQAIIDGFGAGNK